LALLGFPGKAGKGNKMKVIREKENAFTIQDLMRLARYVDDGRRTEGTLRHVVSCWLQGPEGNKRVKVINDNGEVVNAY
jgi:hypothetical protein